MENMLTIFIDNVDNYEDEIQEDLREDAFHCDKTNKDYLYKLVLTEEQLELRDSVGRMVPIGLEAIEEMITAMKAVDALLHKQNVMSREFESWAVNMFNSLGGNIYVER